MDRFHRRILISSKSWNKSKKGSFSVLGRKIREQSSNFANFDKRNSKKPLSLAYPMSYINLKVKTDTPTESKISENSPTRLNTANLFEKSRKNQALKFSKYFLESLHYKEILNFKKDPKRKNFLLTSKKITLVPSP